MKGKRLHSLHKHTNFLIHKYIFNLLRTAGHFIDLRCKGQERIISITIGNKEVGVMQI